MLICALVVRAAGAFRELYLHSSEAAQAEAAPEPNTTRMFTVCQAMHRALEGAREPD